MIENKQYYCPLVNKEVNIVREYLETNVASGNTNSHIKLYFSCSFDSELFEKTHSGCPYQPTCVVSKGFLLKRIG